MRYDQQNCGACGAACGDDEICCLGSCIDPRTSERHCSGRHLECGPSSEYQCCEGACTGIRDDEANCGECGVACKGSEICIDGTCLCTD